MSDIEVRQQRGAVRVLPLAAKHWRTDHLHWSQKTAALMASRSARAKTAGITVSASTIAMIETGDRQPSLLVAESMAEAYGIPLGAFAERLDVPAERVAS